MGVGAAVSGVQDEVRAAAGKGFFLDRLHQPIADATAAEALRDDHRRELAAEVVALDEVLHVESSKAGDLAVELRDEQERRRILGDSLEALYSLRFA